MGAALKMVLPVAVLIALGIGSCKRVGDPVASDACGVYCEEWQSEASDSFDELYDSIGDCETDCMGDFDGVIEEISECDDKMTDYMDCLSVASQLEEQDPCADERQNFMDCADGVAGGPCDRYLYTVLKDIEAVCADHPDCSFCEDDPSTSTGESDDDVCQDALDVYDSDAIIEAYQTICEAEANG